MVRGALKAKLCKVCCGKKKTIWHKIDTRKKRLEKNEVELTGGKYASAPHIDLTNEILVILWKSSCYCKGEGRV